MSKSSPFFEEVTLTPRWMKTSGREPSRRLLVVAGVHGNEQNAVLATHKAMEFFKKSEKFHQFSKTEIKFIIGANRFGLIANCREWVNFDSLQESAGDPVDMNRIFGEDDASIPGPSTLQEMQKLILSAAKESDAVIDIHNSYVMENSLLINNDEHAAAYVKFCTENSIRYVVRESVSSTIKKYAISHGKVGITVEMGGLTLSQYHTKVIDDQTEFVETLIDKILDADTDVYKDMTEVNYPPFRPTELMQPVVARAYGLLEFKSPSAALIKKDNHVAYLITDSDNLSDGDILAPCDGWIAACNPSIVVKPGDEMFYWQPKIVLPSVNQQ